MNADKEQTYIGARRKEFRSGQHTEYGFTVQTPFFNQSGSTEGDNMIATVHDSLLYTLMTEET